MPEPLVSFEGRETDYTPKKLKYKISKGIILFPEDFVMVGPVQEVRGSTGPLVARVLRD